MAHILVVGAAGGVGSAVAGKLAARADTISTTVLDAAEEMRVRQAIPAVHAVHQLDLGDADNVRAKLGAALADEQALHAVIVCAAISPYGPLETMPLAVARKTMEINCLSDIAIYQAAMPALRRTGGRFIFISSMAGRAAMPFVGAYSASKYALEAAADVMRREAGPQGVSVVLIEPGGIRTPMVDEQLRTVVDRIAALGDEERARYGYLYEGFHRLAGASRESSSSTPEEVADVVIGALDADRPATRYMAGQESKDLLGLAASVPDEELDAVFMGMFKG